MDAHKRLNSWLLSRYRELSLKVTQLHWVDEWMPGISDLQVSIVLDGRQYVGRGVAESSDLAFTKAGAEALERAFCFEHNISTCGVAVHTEEGAARENARNELVERDRFFCHYLTRTPFEKFDLDEYGVVREKLKEHDITMKIFEMITLNGIVSFVCFTQGEKTGLLVGLGAGQDVDIAIGKAVRECLINTLASLHGKITPLGFGEFDNLKVCQSEDHRRLYQGEKALIEKNTWMLSGGLGISEPEFVEEGSFRYERLYGRNELLQEAPIIVVKCENDWLQKSFYGNFSEEHINIARIRRFSAVSELNRFPHPLG